MDNIINGFIDYLANHLIVSIIIGCLILFSIISTFAVFLNRINNIKYGKTTIIAWIPILNIYLLGKLAINVVVGFLLMIALLFGICISFNIKGLESIHNILPKEYVLPYQIVFGVIFIILIIVAQFKLAKMVRNGTGKDRTNSFVKKNFEEKEVSSNDNLKEKEINDSNNFYSPNYSSKNKSP